MPRFEVVFWKKGQRAIVTQTWGSRISAITDMQQKANKFNSLSGSIDYKENRITWTSRDKRKQESYYVRENTAKR